MSHESKAKFQEALRYLSSRDRASLNKVTIETKGDANSITEADIDQIIVSIAEKYKSLTADQLSAIKAKLQSMVHTGANNLSELIAQAEAEASGYAEDNAQQQNQTPEQQIAHLWVDTKEKEKDIEFQMREAHERNDISDEAYNKWLKVYRAAQALPDNDPNKADLTVQAAALAEHDLTNAANKATVDGRDIQANHYHKGVVSAHIVEDNMKEIHKLYAQGQKERQQETAKTEKRKMRFSDDDTAQTTSDNASKEKQALEVSDATLNDVQAPVGGKDRSPSKAVVKT